MEGKTDLRKHAYNTNAGMSLPYNLSRHFSLKFTHYLRMFYFILLCYYMEFFFLFSRNTTNYATGRNIRYHTVGKLTGLLMTFISTAVSWKSTHMNTFLFRKKKCFWMNGRGACMTLPWGMIEGLTLEANASTAVDTWQTQDSRTELQRDPADPHRWSLRCLATPLRSSSSLSLYSTTGVAVQNYNGIWNCNPTTQSPKICTGGVR